MAIDKFRLVNSSGKPIDDGEESTTTARKLFEATKKPKMRQLTCPDCDAKFQGYPRSTRECCESCIARKIKKLPPAVVVPPPGYNTELALRECGPSVSEQMRGAGLP